MSLIFDRNYLMSLYASDQQRRMAHIDKLIEDNTNLRSADLFTLPKSTSAVKRELQIDKDETILTLFTFAALHKGSNPIWNRLLSNLFFDEWSDVEVEYKLEIEKAISAPKFIQDSLKQEASRHPVKYAREISGMDKRIEGPTNYDAILEAGAKKVFFECKFTSDISHDTTHCTSRNQIARCIDVGLASLNDSVEDFFFVLVTPSRYTEYPGDRLYYYKMEQYRQDPMAIVLDIPRLYNWYDSEENHWKLEKLTKRIAWLTWEECLEMNINHDYLTQEQKEQLIAFYKDRLLYHDYSELPL